MLSLDIVYSVKGKGEERSHDSSHLLQREVGWREREFTGRKQKEDPLASVKGGVGKACFLKGKDKSVAGNNNRPSQFA